MLHGPVRGPAGQEHHPRFPVQPPRAHQSVVKASGSRRSALHHRPPKNRACPLSGHRGSGKPRGRRACGLRHCWCPVVAAVSCPWQDAWRSRQIVRSCPPACTATCCLRSTCRAVVNHCSHSEGVRGSWSAGGRRFPQAGQRPLLGSPEPERACWSCWRGFPFASPVEPSTGPGRGRPGTPRLCTGTCRTILVQENLGEVGAGVPVAEYPSGPAWTRLNVPKYRVVTQPAACSGGVCLAHL